MNKTDIIIINLIIGLFILSGFLFVKNIENRINNRIERTNVYIYKNDSLIQAKTNIIEERDSIISNLKHECDSLLVLSIENNNKIRAQDYIIKRHKNQLDSLVKYR